MNQIRIEGASGIAMPSFFRIRRGEKPMAPLKLVNENGRINPAETYAPVVSIYADASCLRNGARDASAGCGAVIIDRNRTELKLIAKYLGRMTNQQAEICACVKALEELRRPCRVEVFSDSKYVVDTMNGRNRMKTNRPYWSRLVEASLGHHITWKWIKGHDGVMFQEAVDRLAHAASSSQRDLLPDDLEHLRDYLSKVSNQLGIRPFEIEVDKIVSRYSMPSDGISSVPGLERLAAFPSAFSS